MEARAHHYVPQSWLAGFTDTGQKDGTIFVTDLRREKQWKTTPPNCGHQRDLYRIDAPDPIAAEKAFGDIENLSGPIFRAMFVEQREPSVEECSILFEHMAIQFMRVPAFRSLAQAVGKLLHDRMRSDLFKTAEVWARRRKEVGLEHDTTPFEKVLAILAKEAGLDADNDWFLRRGYESAQRHVKQLPTQWWQTAISPSGSFIGCDNPVMLDAAHGDIVGFETAPVVIFPANRYCLMFGTKQRGVQPHVTRKIIAGQNTLAILSAEEQIYSHVPDFCWMDGNGKYQTDWKLILGDEKLKHRRAMRRSPIFGSEPSA